METLSINPGEYSRYFGAIAEKSRLFAGFYHGDTEGFASYANNVEISGPVLWLPPYATAKPVGAWIDVRAVEAAADIYAYAPVGDGGGEARAEAVGRCAAAARSLFSRLLLDHNEGRAVYDFEKFTFGEAHDVPAGAAVMCGVRMDISFTCAYPLHYEKNEWHG